MYWKKKDPLINLEKKMNKIMFKKLRNYKIKVKKEIESAFKFAKKGSTIINKNALVETL